MGTAGQTGALAHIRDLGFVIGMRDREIGLNCENPPAGVAGDDEKVAFRAGYREAQQNPPPPK